MNVAGERKARRLPRMTHSSVFERADAGILLTMSCRGLELPRQPHYWRRNDPIWEADALHACRINVLQDWPSDDLTFGY